MAKNKQHTATTLPQYGVDPQPTNAQSYQDWAAAANWMFSANLQGGAMKEREVGAISNMAQLYQNMMNNQFAADQADLAYDRSKAENQVELMMQAGMTRQAALAALQGGATAAPATASGPGSIASAGGYSPSDVINGIGTGVQAISTIYSLGASAATLPYTIKAMKLANDLAQTNQKAAQRVLSASLQSDQFASAYDAALKSPNFDPSSDGATAQSTLNWFKSHPDESPAISNLLANIAENGVFSESFNSFQDGWHKNVDNDWHTRMWAANIEAAELQPDLIESEIALNAANIDKVVHETAVVKLEEMLEQERVRVMVENGGLEKEFNQTVQLRQSEINLNKANASAARASAEASSANARFLTAQSINQEMLNKVKEENATLWTQSLLNDMQRAALEYSALQDPAAMEAYKQKIINNEKLNSAIAYLQAASLGASVSQFNDDPQFRKMMKFWSNPIICNGIGLWSDIPGGDRHALRVMGLTPLKNAGVSDYTD